MGPTMSDAMDSDVREVIRRRIAIRERDGHERLLLNHEALLALLDAADERDRLAAAAERVRALADGWRYKGEFGWGAWQEGYGPDEHGELLDYAACEIIRALDGADDGPTT